MDLSSLYIEIGLASAAIGLIAYLILKDSGRKQKVFVLERESKVSFGIFRAKLFKEGNPSLTKLMLGRDKFDIPAGYRPMLLRQKLTGATYQLLFFLENGVLIKPTNEMTEPFDPLMQPKDLGSDGEKKVLGWLTNVRGNTTDRFAILIGAAVGLGIGYMIFNYWHPGLVQGPPSGYTYIVQHLNATSTAATH